MNDQDLDPELEQVLRAGLHRHAEDAVADPAVLSRVRTTSGQRRRRRWAAVGAAAAAVVGISATSVIVAGNDGDKPPAAVDKPTKMRAESWAGLTVDVPRTWGYGTTGTEFAGQRCVPGPIKGPRGEPWESDGLPAGTGWVGRPIALTDVCTTVSGAPDDPTAPYVFLDADIRAGTVDFDNGYVQETVEVEGVRLTVATDDATLRRKIIDSARAGTTCAASFGNTIPSGSQTLTADSTGDLENAHVCAYRDIDGEFVLTYAASVPPEQAAASYAAQEAAPEVSHDDACMGDLSEFVVLDADYDDLFGSEPFKRRAVFEMGCGGEVSLGNKRTQLVADGVEPWAVGGIRSTVIGPINSSEALAPYFIGLLG